MNSRTEPTTFGRSSNELYVTITSSAFRSAPFSSSLGSGGTIHLHESVQVRIVTHCSLAHSRSQFRGAGPPLGELGNDGLAERSRVAAWNDSSRTRIHHL